MVERSREVRRPRLFDCFIIEMLNAHPSIQHKRHPHLHAIAQYVQNRNQILNSIAAPRDAAKNLFIRLVYDGSIEHSCTENNVDQSSLPPIVAQFRADQCQLRRLDEANNVELLRKLREEDIARASELLQYVLNTTEERRVIDAASRAVERAGGQTMAF